MSMDSSSGPAFEATDSETGEVFAFHGRQLVLPGEVTTIGLNLPDDLSFEQWAGIGTTLQGVNRSLMWWIGDWLRYGERRWGRMYEQAIEETGRKYQNLADAKYVAERFDFSCRHEKLSWKHHREVASLPPDQADKLLARAETEGLSTRDVRSEVARTRNAEAIGTTIANDQTCNAGDLWKLADLGQRFGAIYADPPWVYDNQGTRAATGNHYEGMTVGDLCELPIGRLAADDAHLHLWTTNAFLFECPKIFEAWGFEFRSSFIWVKPQIGIGNYWRNSHEFLLTAIRGNAKRFNDRALRSWIECERSKHSAKPERVRQYIERASPGPYLELFARSPARNWTVWGNQIERGLFFQNIEEVA